MYDFWDYFWGAFIMVPVALTLIGLVAIFLLFGLVSLLMFFPKTGQVLVREKNKSLMTRNFDNEEEW
jgi:hypothetical protein